MSILLESERKGAKAGLFLASIYVALAVGAASMAYPFAAMIAGSLASQYDTRRAMPFVRALFDREDRFTRSIASHFRVFPREVYPDAPAHWTLWSDIAADAAGVEAFARRELSRGADEKRARAFMEKLAASAPDELSCKPSPRDVPRFLEERYGTIEALNKAWDIPRKSFYDVSFAAEARGGDSGDAGKRAAWREYKTWCAKRSLAAGDFVSQSMPADLAANAAEVRNALAAQFLAHGTRDLLAEAAGNYALVAEYLFARGRAFFNTLALVVLSIVVSLTVNPLAAYALSRFGMKCTEKIILFLLATSAFPAAVTAIPGFLLMRDLGLLNTLAALVLPGAASGMSIFILKGFFDALPRELYEAAAIDGAGEATVFLRITLPMAKPILAVNALTTFMHAYASWEWAFLVCNREENWTLAVWLYHMSAETFIGQPWCLMAAFALVSLPTAAVFLLCQKAIMRGIVLPSMK